MIMSEIPDNAGSNQRKKVAWSLELPPNILYIRDLGCVAHRVHRCISQSTDEEKIVGDVHAVHYVMAVPRYRSIMSVKLREVISEDLEMIDAPRDEWSSFARKVCMHTLGREYQYVKGHRYDTTADIPDTVRVGIYRLCALLNGDWRNPPGVSLLHWLL